MTDFDAIWKRDKELIRARQELASATEYIRSAMVRASKDKRTKHIKFAAAETAVIALSQGIYQSINPTELSAARGIDHDNYSRRL